MKIKSEIEVSGIKRIVIDKTLLWERGKPEVADCWFLRGEHKGAGIVKYHTQMSKYINSLISNSNYHAWISGDTINIHKRTL